MSDSPPPRDNEPDDPAGDGYEWDPTFLNCRREARTALVIWFLALCWTVPVSYLTGYPGEDFDPATLSTVLGIPSWAFWGVMLPWGLCLVATVWFCLFYMQDDHLGDAPEDAEA